MESRTQVRRGRRLGVAALGVVAALALAATPALAVQWDPTTQYDEVDSWSYDDCGFDVSAEGHWWGTFATRQGTGPDAGAFFGRNKGFQYEVHTRVSNGVTVIFSGTSQFIEVKGVRVEGSIFEFSAINAGVSTLRYGDGTLILRNAGTYRESILFDTLGDGVPGGEFISQTSWYVAGPHPGDELDWCALFE